MGSAETRLRINQRYCKGCGICVAFCPKGVLVLQKDKVRIEDPEKCIKCGMCELRCPDYAIWVEEIREGDDIYG